MKWSWQLKTLINLQLLLRISFDHFITCISTEKFIKPWKRFSLYWICKSYLGKHFVKQLHNTLYTIHTSAVYRNSHKLLVSWDTVELRKLRKNIHFASKQLTIKTGTKRRLLHCSDNKHTSAIKDIIINCCVLLALLKTKLYW